MYEGCSCQVHRRYVEEMEAAESAAGRGWDVLFYGDSIMEEWRWDPPLMSPLSCSTNGH